VNDVTTTAQRWQRVKTILADALEHPSAEDRTAYLERSCDGDTTLMREVEELLALSTENLDELADNTPVAFTRPAPVQPIGQRIGAYEIVREIGRGGMGAVYLAKRADGQFEKEVAIKLLKRGTDTDEILRRFRGERRILARLDHPNIARLLDAGTTDDGLPYFVMEYIKGVPITRYACEGQLSVAQRLQLFLKVCEAVQFAHQQRVVHRDLKPGNIFVRQDGEPKLLDFGIAKLLVTGDERTEQTLTAERRFTLVCASPEQARGETVTPASDVYALGALLYELLTDRPPHRFSTPHPSPAEVAQVIGEQEPTRPSLSIYDNQVRRQLRGDLDKIVLMALRKEPARRYSSIAAFAEDIRRHVEGRPVRARPNTAAYLTTRFIVRHKQPIGALFVAAAVALSFLLFYHPRTSSPPQNSGPLAASDKSIAVLPFENLSDDKANSFFADGMQDEILTDLAKVADLKVISRTSVMQYKNATSRNLREIARQLGVAHVLEGSVQRVANRIRVSAQLIDARTDAHLWAEHYDRDASDVFAIQNEIAKSIAEQLQAKISPNERKALEEKPTSDLVAYDLYLRAKALLDRISVSTDWEGDNRRAVDLLDRAVTQDPNFALAHSLLYDWNLNLYDWVDRTPARLARAEAALKEMIRIAPEAGETYLARSTEYKRAGDLERASEMLEQASKVLPGSSHISLLLAQIERRRGQWSKTVQYWEKARDLDPKSPNIPNGLCDLYAALRDYTKADQVADAAIAAFPKGPGYFLAAKVHNALDRGDVMAARTALAALLPDWDPSGITSMMRVEVAVADRNYAEVAHLSATRKKENVIAEIGADISFMEVIVARKQGDRAREQSILSAMREHAEADLHNRPDDIYSLSRLARIDAYLGRSEDALRESEKAVELKPISRDAVSGPASVAALAEVCMVTGDHTRAIQLLSEVARIPYGPSYGDLLGPRWDALRDDPRFAKLIKEAAQPIDLTSTGGKKTAEPAIPEKSIAVLPFENLSDDKANAFFADGMQDEILTDLAKVADLKVISRTSVMQYKNVSARNLREIARQLGVAHVLEGSVQRVANRIRVSAQLIDARTDAHLWAEHYDRDATDVFAIQNEIAKSIVEQLQAKISPNERKALDEKPTNDVVAYDLYLRAKALMDEIATSTDWEGDNRRAIDLLDRAVTHDPKFAAAYAQLCDFHLNLYDWVEHTPQRLAQAETAVQEAIRLAPSSPTTYLAQADFVARQRNWTQSLEFLQRAQKLQPGDAKLLIRIALAEDHLGQSLEAVRDLEKARELAPRDPNIPNQLDWMYTGFRDYRKSDEVADAAIANFPNGPNYYRTQKVLNALHRGDWKEAARRLALIPEKFDPSGFRSLLRLEIPFGERDSAEFERILASVPRNNLIGIMERDVVFMEALLAEKQGDRAKMESVLNAFRVKLEVELRTEGLDKGPSYHPLQIANLALVHCYLGQMEDALRESQQAIELVPRTKDAMKWAPDACVRAEVLMRAGQPDRAIDLLEEVAKAPYGPSYGELLGLQWDRLRDDPRFAQVLEEARRPIELVPKDSGVNIEAILPEKSIAVLPFDHLSDDNGHSYFTDGIQEDIQASLAKVADLKVTSHASAALYRGPNKNIREIGRALRVAHVLEGSVQNTQDHVRVYARLTDTRSGAQLWAEQYDRAVDDLFAIQNEITSSIVAQLKAALSPQEQALMREKPTKDMVAYDLYLQAREIECNTFNGMGETTREIVLLDEATRRDPAFVAALCLLARAHLNLYWLNLNHTPIRLELAKKALDTAGQSRPDAGEVHLARAILYYWGSRDYRRALEELAIAHRQLPNDPDVLVFTVGIEKRQGHWAEARRVCEQAIVLDPLNPGSLRDYARSIYVSMRLYAEASRLLDTLLSWKPNDFGLQRSRAYIEVASKADLTSLQSLVSGESARTADPNLLANTRLELALWRRDYEAAERALADFRLEDSSAGGFVTPRQWFEGIVARSRGDKEAAQNAFALAHERVAATVRNRPDDAKALIMLAQIDAALGHKEEAIKEGLRAIELLPVSKDAADGPTILGGMASVYAQLGETKAALDLLESCAAMPNGPDFGSLKLDQKWDPLRRDPRFAQVLEESARSIELISADKRAIEPAIPDKSIAVLPLKNLSDEKENAYLAEAIQDEILTRLSKIADLKVISRTSTQHYKSAPENLPEIARQLGVANILEGSVQKNGDTVRVNVQLFKAADDSHLWADSFDRKITDIFLVESEVAKAIADQLRAKLTGLEEQVMTTRPTENTEAYNAYLRALAYNLKTGNTPANSLGAQKYLREAVGLDPKFALAWALLSYVDAHGYITSTLQPTAALREEARQAAETALTLQPDLGEALLAKGNYYYACLKDYDGAVRYFEQARPFLPNSSRIPESLGYAARRRGQWDQCDSYFNEAERLDPRNVNLLSQHARSYVALRRFPEALRKFNQVLDITPDDVSTLVQMAIIAQAEGDLPRASALLAPLHPNADDFRALETQVNQAILERHPAQIIPRLTEIVAKPTPALGYINGELRFWLGWAQEIAGDHTAAQESWRLTRGELEAFLKDQPENFALIGHLALTNMGLGDKAAALALAERAVAANPIERDAVNGPDPIEFLARVAAGTGNPERAIGALQKLLSIPYNGALAAKVPLTPALLRLDPMFDPLRKDPRFDKIVASLGPGR
jgi:TolB-like protein/Tfp pilus assembly protein PilF